MSDKAVFTRIIKVGKTSVAYKLFWEMYDDDYGSTKSSYEVWKYEKGKPRERVTPAHYNYSRTQAENAIPRPGAYKKCKCCNSVYFKAETKKFQDFYSDVGPE